MFSSASYYAEEEWYVGKKMLHWLWSFVVSLWFQSHRFCMTSSTAIDLVILGPEPSFPLNNQPQNTPHHRYCGVTWSIKPSNKSNYVIMNWHLPVTWGTEGWTNVLTLISQDALRWNNCLLPSEKGKAPQCSYRWMFSRSAPVSAYSCLMHIFWNACLPKTIVVLDKNGWREKCGEINSTSTFF